MILCGFQGGVRGKNEGNLGLHWRWCCFHRLHRWQQVWMALFCAWFCFPCLLFLGGLFTFWIWADLDVQPLVLLMLSQSTTIHSNVLISTEYMDWWPHFLSCDIWESMASRKKYNTTDDDGSQPFGHNHLIFYFWSLAPLAEMDQLFPCRLICELQDNSARATPPDM